MNFQWILVGEIVSTQGNQGEVRVVPHTEFPERFSHMEQVRVFPPGNDQTYTVYDIESCRFHKGFVVLKLANIDSIDQGLTLKGMRIMVSQDEVVPLPPDRHYIFQLIGLEVVTEEGMTIGTITDVLETGANDVYVVKAHPGVASTSEVLIPVIADVVKEINLDQGRIIIHLLDGLLD